MPAPVVFARNHRLSAASPTLQIASIPQTAAHLEILVTTRFDASVTNQQFVGLRINGDSSSVYRANASQGSTGSLSTGIGGDGYNVAQFVIGEVNEAQANHAGMFGTFRGMIPRYAEAIPHGLVGIGSQIFDDGNTDTEYQRIVAGGWHNSAVAITQLDVFNEEAADFAVGSELQIWGLAESGDLSLISRAAGTLALDFEGEEFLDIALSAGANVFTASNPKLGKLIQARLTGGDGTSTITLPAGTEVLEDSYVAGSAAWLSIRCVDESGPAFIANLKDIL